MNETEKLQSLHQRSISGENLTPQEQIELKNWYENLDRDEDSFLNNSQPIQNVEDLRRNLANITNQTAEVSREVKTLILQNEQIRKETQDLKKSLEAHLLEKVA